MGLGRLWRDRNTAEQVGVGARPASGTSCRLRQRKALSSPFCYREECGGAEEGGHCLHSPCRLLGKSEAHKGTEGSQPAHQTSRMGLHLPHVVGRPLEEMDGPSQASVPGLWLGTLASQRD